MHYFLDIKLILLFAALGFSFRLSCRLFKTQLFKLFFEFVITFFIGVEEEDLEEKMHEIDDGIGVREDFIVRELLLGCNIGFLTYSSLEVLNLYKISSEDKMGDQQVKELLFYF